MYASLRLDPSTLMIQPADETRTKSRISNLAKLKLSSLKSASSGYATSAAESNGVAALAVPSTADSAHRQWAAEGL